MREIKFRAWDEVSKKMFYKIGLSVGFFVFDGTGELKLHDGIPVMQYTELKDKNGKEIYEGDIVTYYCGSDKQARPMAVEIPGIYISDNASDGYMATHTYEIIGNIYENPELPCQ